jgi:type IV pilus assembly protein PilC
LLRAVSWPLIELGLTLLIVALLIMLPLLLPRQPDGRPQDLLGWGLVGYSGLAIYSLVLMLVGFLVITIMESIRRERPLARWLLAILERLPMVGVPLTDLALGRIAWSLSMTTDTAMPLQQSFALAFQASQLPRLIHVIPRVQQLITEGNELHHALRITGQLPAEFLDAIEVGEETGKLPEAMERLSRSFDDRSRAAIQRLSIVVGVVVWVGVAILIISLIFQLYGNYLRTLQGFM